MKQSKVKIGIYGLGLLMMGVIGISGALATIGGHFSDASPTTIQSIISIPCLVVIPVTLVVGKMMDFISKKNLALLGILLFLLGGVGPAFMTSLTSILVLRGILGLGIGIIQPVASALVAENFEGPERDRVQGNVTSAQMLGCALMVFAGGWLGNLSWQGVFYVHLIAVVSFVCVLLFIPTVKPNKATVSQGEAIKVTLTKGSWKWALSMFVLFLGAQVYSVYLSFLVVDEKALGTAAEAGNGLAFFAIGGFVMGLVFGKLMGKTKSQTLTVGLAGIILSYLCIAFAGNMAMIYAGCFLFGLSLSICMPCIIVGTAGSVDPLSVGMAISITMCAQNFAQFLCPYLLNPITATMGNGTNNNQLAFYIGAAIVGILAVSSFISGAKNKSGA